MRGGYGRPPTRTIFGLVFVCRVTGTLRTTLCSGAAPIAPPGPFSHARFCSPGLSLSLFRFFCLSLSLLGLWGPLSGIGVARRLRRIAPKMPWKSAQNTTNPGNYFLVWKGDMLCFFLQLYLEFLNSTRLFPPNSSFAGQSNRGFQIEDFPRLLCVSERGNAVRFCRRRFPPLSRKVRPRGDGIFCDIRSLDF